MGEIRCARCGARRTGSSPHTCDIVQEQTHKVETSPMARHLLRRAGTCSSPKCQHRCPAAAASSALTLTDGATPAQAAHQGTYAVRHRHALDPLAGSRDPFPSVGSETGAPGTTRVDPGRSPRRRWRWRRRRRQRRRQRRRRRRRRRRRQWRVCCCAYVPERLCRRRADVSECFLRCSSRYVARRRRRERDTWVWACG